jgi:hypothetical protein
VSENASNGTTDHGPEAGDSLAVRLIADVFFWLFSAAGVAILAGWILIPEYFDYVAAHKRTEAVRRDVARLEVRNRQYQEVLEALAADPEYVRRLGLARAPQAVAANPAPALPPAPGRRNAPPAPSPPSPDGPQGTAEVADQAPELRLPEPTEDALRAQQERIPGTRLMRVDIPDRYAQLFTSPERRPVLMAIAIGCLTIAFAFFAPQHRPARVGKSES